MVDGTVAAVMASRGRLAVVLAFTIVGERITEIDVIADEDRLRVLEISVL